MESLIVQELGVAGSKACIRLQVIVDYFIIPYTSIFILSHLHQECHAYIIVIRNDMGMR